MALALNNPWRLICIKTKKTKSKKLIKLCQMAGENLQPSVLVFVIPQNIMALLCPREWDFFFIQSDVLLLRIRFLEDSMLIQHRSQHVRYLSYKEKKAQPFFFKNLFLFCADYPGEWKWIYLFIASIWERERERERERVNLFDSPMMSSQCLFFFFSVHHILVWSRAITFENLPSLFACDLSIFILQTCTPMTFMVL